MASLRMILIAALLFTQAAAAFAEVSSDLKATLFREASQALAQANSVKANIFAPVAYSEGAERYRDAEEKIAEGGSIESIQRSLSKAVEHFTQAVSATDVAQVSLADAIAARNDAQNAEATKFAPEPWQEAEESFATAAARLEQGSVKSAQRIGEEARERYRAAELTAIKSNYLDETRNLLDAADKARAKRYAPETLKRAQALLAEAEKALDEDRYDTDRVRSLAQEAKYEARHAIHLAELSKQIRDRKLSVEESQLAWEVEIRKVAAQLDRSIDFADGPEPAARFLVSNIASLQQELSEADTLVSDKEMQIAALTEQVSVLETRLGGESESLQQLNALMAEQDRIRARIKEVEDMYSEDQAVVLRKGNDVIIRMVGLNFDSGEAIIKTEHYSLLGTLRQALDLFPKSPVVMEGHTDAFGSDESNLALSERRAEAVAEYMRAVAGFDADRLTAIGYGETRPAANNETVEGRKRNRRIDVVISRAGEMN